jgi:hypothetical protein
MVDNPQAARAKRRAAELREMIEAGPTRRGECDDCHGTADLYDDPCDPDAGWGYCRRCAGDRIARAEARGGAR